MNEYIYSQINAGNDYKNTKLQTEVDRSNNRDTAEILNLFNTFDIIIIIAIILHVG
jgi:hypothetical protein